jgi:purine nucleosidase/pyrimidine-specific ribonucleoside hydrolase
VTRRVIIDTDPGIDDAIAILFALAHPELDVAAITTIAGNIGLETTTHNALRILALAGQSVPVHPGAARSLKRGSRTEVRIHSVGGLGGVAFPEPEEPASSEPAHMALRRLIADAPAGTIDILALAPLTNIARFVEEAPDVARRIGRLIAMGGAVREPGNVGQRSEFNIAHDPEAAEIVFSAGLPLTLVPLDVTRRVRADAAYLARLAALGTKEALVCRDLIAAYLTGTSGGESRPLHAPCVPLLALRPDLFATHSMRLSVNLDEGELAGALEPGEHALAVAMGTDAPAVLDLLAETLGQAPSSPRTTSHQ